MKADEAAGVVASLYTCLPDHLRQKFGSGIEAALKHLAAKASEEKAVLAETGTLEMVEELKKRFDSIIFVGGRGPGFTHFSSGPVHARVGLAEMMSRICSAMVRLSPYDDGSAPEVPQG